MSVDIDTVPRHDTNSVDGVDWLGYAIASLARIERSLKIQVLSNLDQLATKLDEYINSVKSGRMTDAESAMIADELRLLVENLAKQPIRRQSGLLRVVVQKLETKL